MEREVVESQRNGRGVVHVALELVGSVPPQHRHVPLDIFAVDARLQVIMLPLVQYRLARMHVHVMAYLLMVIAGYLLRLLR